MNKLEQQDSGLSGTFKQGYGRFNDTHMIEISPFSLSPKLDIVVGSWYDGISEWHGTNDWLLLPRATAGLKILRRFLQIEKLSVLTTFNTHYISGCVLEAFKGAMIYRDLQEEVDAIMVIHEWGKPLPNLGGIKKWAEGHETPLIEDCALTMRKDLGVHGDFVLYSFPKLLPMDSGGLLIGMNDGDLDEGMLQYTLEKDDAQSTGTQYLGHMKHIEEN
ncbi:MAG: DegT/DnrJ/EryC1/StrS aminotransferase family protein, partial [Candidatus Thermoplasmatota archaeon]|nr:DegT/DnrJ/EryC1/StrS aminotransferase family protein [Candidatus Thermoplasmatota archaeon]